MESIQNAILRGQPVDWALMIFFLLLFVFYTIYLLFFILRVTVYKIPPAGKENSLSLLITFRNEEMKLRDNLSSILANGHNGYEVVAVDNCSQDDSLVVLNAFKNEHPNLRISSLKQHTFHSGKMAQNIALKAASNDWVTVIPSSVNLGGKEWLREITSRLHMGNQILIGYSNVVPGGSFFNLLFRCEFFFQQLKSFGFIVNGFPFVLSQENVAFKKQLYFDEGGYRGKINEPFANLELVINSFIQKAPVSLVLTREATIHRKEDITCKDYVELLKKEVNVRKFLSPGIRTLLIFYEWIFLLFVPFAVAVLVRIPLVWPIVTAMVICLVFCYLLIIKKLLFRLQEFKLFLPSFLMALMLPYFKLVFRIRYFRYGRKKEWKIGE